MNPYALILLAAMGGAACTKDAPAGGSSAQALKTYAAKGVVRNVDPQGREITISHEAIPGYMQAMTMVFEVRTPDLVKGLAAGDKVEFTFSDDGKGKIVVETIKKTP
jgi:protein SCO1/2